MNKNWNNFCALVALFLTFAFTSVAQLATKSAHSVLPAPKTLTVSPYSFTHSTIFSNKQPGVQVQLGSPFSHWGIMCIGEYKLEKKTGIPFRFRLGSLDYVNKLEGKH